MSTAAGRRRAPEDLARVQLGTGQVALWWLGQAGFAIRGNGVTLLVDPFLSEHPDRTTPPPFWPSEATGVQAVLCTHEHIDHFDQGSLPGLATASPEARFVVPRPIAALVTDLGVAPERVIGAQPGEPVELAGVTVHPVPACHGVDMADAYGFGRELSGGLVRFLGFVLDLGGVRVYHAGDTIPYDGMAEQLRELRPAVALLPINGRDRYREAAWNIVGNMDHREAARLAVDVGVELLVPMHHDMFSFNLGFPAHLVDVVERCHPGLTVLVPGRDRPFVFGPAAW